MMKIRWMIFVSVLMCCSKLPETVTPQYSGAGVSLLKIMTMQDTLFQKIAKKAVLTITASDMLTMSSNLSVTDTIVEGLIKGIPAGTNRLFTVTVYDSLDSLEYKGSSTANIVADSTVLIGINVYRISGDAMVNGNVIEADTVSFNGLIAYYPFTGNALDESGNGFNLTVHGASLTTDRFGNQNGAYVFDGVSNYLGIEGGKGIDTVFQQVTIAAWVKAYAYPAQFADIVYICPRTFLLGFVGENIRFLSGNDWAGSNLDN